MTKLFKPTLFYQPEAVYLEDLLWIWVRAWFSRSCLTPMDTARTAVLLPNQNPFSALRNSRALLTYAEKTTLPRVQAGFTSSVCVTTRNENLIPSPLWTRLYLNKHRTLLHWTMLPLYLWVDWLVFNGCTHKTHLHIDPLGPPWSICYYHERGKAGGHEPSLFPLPCHILAFFLFRQPWATTISPSVPPHLTVPGMYKVCRSV